MNTRKSFTVLSARQEWGNGRRVSGAVGGMGSVGWDGAGCGVVLLDVVG